MKMTNKEIAQLLIEIKAYYPRAENNPEKTKSWIKALKDEDNKRIQANFKSYYKNNPYEPSIFNIIAGNKNNIDMTPEEKEKARIDKLTKQYKGNI